MKKSFPANINGSIFYIDEDAYQLLNTYLDQMRKAFPGTEGEEIATDIEGRIGEHFTERINSGARVITVADVNTVITAMGRPDDIADDTKDDEASAKAKPSDTKEPPVGVAPHTAPTPPPFAAGSTSKRLYRSEQNKVFGGVFAGLGVYLGWNANIMRVLFIILTFWLQMWPGVVAYLVAWMVIPPARTPRQILEMNGQAVTPDNVGRTILGTAAPEPARQITLTSIGAILGKIILGFFGLIAGCVGLAALFVLLIVLSAFFVYLFMGAADAMSVLAIVGISNNLNIATGTAFGLLTTLSVLTPCIALIWAACCALFNARHASRTTIIVAAILEVIFIVAAVVIYHLSVVPALYGVATVAAVAPLPILS